MSSANSSGRPSDSRADSRQRDDWRTEDPRRDQQGRHGARKALKDNRTPLLSGRGEMRQGLRPPASNNHGAGGRPSALQIQLNKRIVGARNFEDVLAIVEAEHGEFNAVNAATACSRLAKAPRSHANSTTIDDLRVQALFRTLTRVAPTMESQAVANVLWAPRHSSCLCLSMRAVVLCLCAIVMRDSSSSGLQLLHRFRMQSVERPSR
jgi:hypothetical protein